MTGITAARIGLAMAGLAGLGGCAEMPGAAPVNQTVPMGFEQCLSRIDETAARIGQTPASLARTSDSRIVRFTDGNEIVIVACDAIGGRMVVQTRPAPVVAAAPTAEPVATAGADPVFDPNF